MKYQVSIRNGFNVINQYITYSHKSAANSAQNIKSYLEYTSGYYNLTIKIEAIQ